MLSSGTLRTFVLRQDGGHVVESALGAVLACLRSSDSCREAPQAAHLAFVGGQHVLVVVTAERAVYAGIMIRRGLFTLSALIADARC